MSDTVCDMCDVRQYGTIQDSNVKKFKNNVMFALNLKKGLLGGFIGLAILCAITTLFARHKYKRSVAICVIDHLVYRSKTRVAATSLR